MRIVLFALLTACTAAPDLEVGEVQQGILFRCDRDFCGTNSPLMTANSTWEFSIKGQRNGQGFRILGLGKGKDFYDLVVKDSRIYGLDKSGNVALEDQKLIGARIYLDQNGKQSAIEIVDASEIKEVVYPHDLLGSYVLDWGHVVSNRLPGRMVAGQTAEGGIEPVLGPTDKVCPEPKWVEEPYAGSVWEWDETMYGGMKLFQSVVFEGDRFDPTTRTVRPYVDESWFNIGCGAHTLAKLRLTRNTVMKAKWTNVQAALKMLGADYCGGGTTFTFPGEPLVWRDQGTMKYRNFNFRTELEARWDENGATCMSSPRLVRTGNPDARAAYADVWQAIEDECYVQSKILDKCTNQDPLAWDGELVTSANYD